jgi:hypothetical protein
VTALGVHRVNLPTHTYISESCQSESLPLNSDLCICVKIGLAIHIVRPCLVRENF